jgi:Tol biopolymer transport system component
MNQRLSVILLILGAAAVAGAGQDSPASIATLGIKELAFEVPQDLWVGGASIESYSLGANGTDLYRVTQHEAATKQIVGGDIFVIDDQDTKPRKVVSGASHPVWSPDGTELAYCTWKGLGFGQIEAVNADGTGRRQITNMKGGACFPDWSPDGKKIIFTALSPGDSEKNLLDRDGMVAKSAELFVVGKDGGDPAPIGSGYAARWSPAGSLLIFLRRSEKKGSEGSIWLGTPDGKQTKMIAVSDQVMRGATWLPSGRGIVASFMSDGAYSIFRFYLDGSQPQGKPPQRVGGDGRISWSEPQVSPDGKHLMAIANCSNQSSQAKCSGERVVILDLDANKEVTLEGGTNYSVVWERK